MSDQARKAEPIESTPVSGVRVRARRPPSQVVVRAGARADFESGESLMPKVPTLVGFEPNAARRGGTLVGLSAPTWDGAEPMEPLPARTSSGKRRPPETLIEDVDHELAERYRREAARILAAGFFS